MTKSSQFINQLGKRFAIYLGGAWVVIEAFSFLVQQYDLDPALIDILILLILFGIPGTLIFSVFKGTFNWKAVSLQIINLILAFGVVFYYVIHPNSINPNKLRILKVSKPPKTALNELKAIAVLPFLNNMGEDQEQLVAGMHDGLITEIGKLGSIKIISRTSVMPYEQTSKNIQQIAGELDVNAIIETSITRVDTMISLHMKLVNAFPEETVLWSHSYEGHLGEIPNLFREVTKNVAMKINKAITVEQEIRLSRDQTFDPAAYEAFLRGTYYAGFLTPENFKKAENHFIDAIAIDSSIVEAYCGLAMVWASRRQMGYVKPQVVSDTVARLIKQAEKIYPENAMVYAQKAVEYTWGTFEWEKAAYNWERCIELNPNSSHNRITYAHFLMIMNRWEEAWEQARYAEALDPESPWVVSFIGIMYLFDGKVLTGSKYVNKLEKIAPDHPLVVEVNFEKEATFNNHDESIKYLKILLERTQVKGIEEFVDRTYKGNDYITTLTKVAEYLEEKRKTQYILPRLIHQIYMVTGDVEKQMETMMLIYEENDPSLPYFAIKGMWSNQDHQVYQSIMKEVGLW
jgi:TolB-like protein/Tfp pilus assembly protein PilF